MNFENRIQKFSYRFSKLDLKIAQYIVKHPFDDSYSTITSLGYAIGVSASSISRFSHKLEYANFQDLKFDIQKRDYKNEIVNSPLIKRIYEYHQSIIQQTGEFISNEQINHLVDLLVSSKFVLLAGLGSSGLSAMEFYYRIMRTGIASNGVTDAHLMKFGASLLGKEDTFIAFSSSGETEELVNTAKIAKDSGAMVVVITNYAGSDLTNYADLVILTIDQKRINDSQFINSQISAHFLIDVVSYRLLESKNHLNQYLATRDIILKDDI